MFCLPQLPPFGLGELRGVEVLPGAGRPFTPACDVEASGFAVCPHHGESVLPLRQAARLGVPLPPGAEVARSPRAALLPETLTQAGLGRRRPSVRTGRTRCHDRSGRHRIAEAEVVGEPADQQTRVQGIHDVLQLVGEDPSLGEA